jgi:hypothetical protein
VSQVATITLARATRADSFASSTLNLGYDGSAAPVLRTTFAKRKAAPSASGARAKPINKKKKLLQVSQILVSLSLLEDVY